MFLFFKNVPNADMPTSEAGAKARPAAPAAARQSQSAAPRRRPRRRGIAACGETRHERLRRRNPQVLRSAFLDAAALVGATEAQVKVMNGMRVQRLQCMADAPANLATLTKNQATNIINDGTDERKRKREAGASVASPAKAAWARTHARTPRRPRQRPRT